MIVSLARLGRVFGDRILIRLLPRPEKTRGFFVPASYAKEKAKEQQIWWGVIEDFGLDSRYGDAYGLKKGDMVGVHDLGASNASFIGDDNQEHFWVMEEFVVAKDDGRALAFREDRPWDNEKPGIIPLGAYALVSPHPVEEKRGSIHIPDSAKEGQLSGRVLAVSAGTVRDGELSPLNVKADTDVLFGQYSGSVARLGKDEFLLVKEEDLIAEMLPTGELAHA